jgi:hypothetical protein
LRSDATVTAQTPSVAEESSDPADNTPTPDNETAPAAATSTRTVLERLLDGSLASTNGYSAADFEADQQLGGDSYRQIFQLLSQVSVLSDMAKDQSETIARLTTSSATVPAIKTSSPVPASPGLPSLPVPVSAHQPAPVEPFFKPLKLPDPPLFSGNDGISYDDWIVQMEGKLDGNRHLFPSDAIRTIYITSRLTGAALTQVNPRLRKDSTDPFASSADLLRHLHDLYVDPNAGAIARQAFKSLQMSTDMQFHTFFTRFSHLATSGGIYKGDLVTEPWEKLPGDLQRLVVTAYDKRPSLQEFARTCGQFDHYRFQWRRPAPRLPAPATSIHALGPTSGPDGRPTYDDPAKQALSRMGACFYCHETGHIAAYCPNKKAKPLPPSSSAPSGKDKP